MSIQRLLTDIFAMENLSFPKGNEWDQEQQRQIFGDALDDRGDTLSVKCSHRCNSPATELAIQQAERDLGSSLPVQLQEFFLATNGAHLFVVPRSELFDTPLVLYRILTTEEVVSHHNNIFSTFRGALGFDPEFRDARKLNYLPFCDVNDGNYLAFHLGGPHQGKIFFLDSGLCYRPYDQRDSDMYYTLANSLEDWLQKVRDTGGLGGQSMTQGFFGGPY